MSSAVIFLHLSLDLGRITVSSVANGAAVLKFLPKSAATVVLEVRKTTAQNAV